LTCWLINNGTGALVHADPEDENYKGGFFGYIVDASVPGGANVTCEILYQFFNYGEG
jgi:hypothetical protein